MVEDRVVVNDSTMEEKKIGFLAVLTAGVLSAHIGLLAYAVYVQLLPIKEALLVTSSLSSAVLGYWLRDIKS